MRSRRLAVMVSTLALVMGLGVAIWPREAGAVTGYQPVPQASWGTNGSNTAVAIANGRVYVGGSFTAAKNGATTEAHSNLAAFDEVTGAVISTWNIGTNGPVEALAVYGDSLYLAGTFTTVTTPGNSFNRKNLAKVSLTTNTVDAFNAAPNNTVFDLWVNGSTLYLVGDFNTVAGQTRTRIAAIDVGNPNLPLVAGFAPSANRRVSSVAAVTVNQVTTVYVGGRFSTVNGSAVDYLAALDGSNGAVKQTGGHFVDYVGVEPPDPATQTSNVLDLAVAPDNSQVFVAIGGLHFNVVGAWDAATGDAPLWRHGVPVDDHLDGDVQGLVLDGKWLYFAFHGGYNGDTKLRVMAADITTQNGDLDPDFRPVTNGVAGITALAKGSKLAAVGDFTTSGEVPLSGVALFPAVGGGGGTTSSSSSSSSSSTSSSSTSSSSSVPDSSSSTSSTSSTTTTTTTSTTLPTGGTATASPTVQTPDRKPSGTIDADDAAFWIDQATPGNSLILGTIKEGGLDVYKPDGTVVQTISASGGRFNNVDLVYPYSGANAARGLAVVTDRKTDKLHIYEVDGSANPPVKDLTAGGVPLLFGTSKPVKSKTAYGVAAWSPSPGVVEVFVSQENTTNLQKVVLDGVGTASVSYHKVGSPLALPNTFTLPNSTSWTPCFNPAHPDWQAHVEGMVVDPATGTLWADQELVGLWKINSNLGSPQLVHKITRYGQTYSVVSNKCKINAGSTSYGDSYLPGDLEGIGLYESGAGGYLVISNQNASLFTVFNRDGGAYRGSFKVGAAGSIDGVDATDGVAVTNLSLGGVYGTGMLITQDGKDTPEGGTNFKFTPWSAVKSALNL